MKPDLTTTIPGSVSPIQLAGPVLYLKMTTLSICCLMWFSWRGALSFVTLRLLPKPAAPMNYDDPQTPHILQPNSPASSDINNISSPHQLKQEVPQDMSGWASVLLNSLRYQIRAFISIYCCLVVDGCYLQGILLVLCSSSPFWFLVCVLCFCCILYASSNWFDLQVSLIEREGFRW